MVEQVENEQLKLQLVQEEIIRCQDWEQMSERSRVSINPTLKCTAGLDMHQESQSEELFSCKLFK